MRTKFFCGVVLLATFSFGFVSQRAFLSLFDTALCTSDLTLIKPNLDCNLSEKKTENLSTLEEKLKENIAEYKEKGRAIRISVFVRELRSTRFVGVDENDLFYMASLLKVTVLIAGYKLAEVEPRVLDQEITYNGIPNVYNEQYIKPNEVLEKGKSYSIRELMRRAIVYSDNTAAQLLYDYYPIEFLDRIIQALGIEFTRPEGSKENFVTARTYANVFRSLYNASYLTATYANEALSTLTKITYGDGATAKLPMGVLVAHKFAERSLPDSKDSLKFIRQLHECGLVYAKDGVEPYTFCIMTEGTDYDALQSILQDLSLDIYNAMTGDTDN
jgi:hypothetical protein